MDMVGSACLVVQWVHVKLYGFSFQKFTKVKLETSLGHGNGCVGQVSEL